MISDPQELLAQFSDIPNDILINNVLPYMKTDVLSYVCQLNKRMERLCANVQVWEIKLRHDYPDVAKSVDRLRNGFYRDLSYHDLYRFVYESDSIPVIYHGDIIGYAYVNHKQNIFSSKLFDAMYPVLNMSFIYALNDENAIVGDNVIFGNDVTKILITDNYIKKDLTHDTLWKELTSELGNPPIYGYLTKHDRKFMVVVSFNDFREVYPCEALRRTRLIEIIADLRANIDTPDLGHSPLQHGLLRSPRYAAVARCLVGVKKICVIS